MDKHRIIALIPARGGSKRIPNKNIKLLGGKPLVCWSIETALHLKLPCYVSTDNEDIAVVAVKAGAAVIPRPAEYATDEVGDKEVICHALNLCHALTQVKADLIVYLRPTTPFRDPRRVWAAIKIMMFYQHDSLRSVEEMAESAFKCFGVKDGYLRPLTKGIDVTDRANQAVPRTFHPNGYVDIVRGEMVERGGIWGAKRHAFITGPVVELDTLEQWEYAEYIIERGKHGQTVN